MTASRFTGGQVGTCPGPIGVTAVQCAKATGIVPETGFGIPILMLAVAIATFLGAPVPRGERLLVVLAGTLCALIAAGAFGLLRPRTMEGFDSPGCWISIHRPLDIGALATIDILCALVGATLTRGIRRGSGAFEVHST